MIGTFLSDFQRISHLYPEVSRPSNALPWRRLWYCSYHIRLRHDPIFFLYFAVVASWIFDLLLPPFLFRSSLVGKCQLFRVSVIYPERDHISHCYLDRDFADIPKGSCGFWSYWARKQRGRSQISAHLKQRKNSSFVSEFENWIPPRNGIWEQSTLYFTIPPGIREIKSDA